MKGKEVKDRYNPTKNMLALFLIFFLPKMGVTNPQGEGIYYKCFFERVFEVGIWINYGTVQLSLIAADKYKFGNKNYTVEE